MDKIVYASLLKEIKSVASGFDHAVRTGDNTFSVFFVDGSQIELTIPLPANGKDGEKGDPGEKGENGISVVGIEKVDETNFAFLLSDGTQTTPIEIPKVDISGKVDKEDGKSLVYNTDIEQITTNKEDIELLKADEDVTNSVRNLIKKAVEGTLHLTKEIIDHKPTVEEVKDEVLYLVPTDKEGVYKQYTKVEDKVVDLDNTEIDLSGYVEKDGDKVLSDNNYTDADKAEVAKVSEIEDSLSEPIEEFDITISSGATQVNLHKGYYNPLTRQVSIEIDMSGSWTSVVSLANIPSKYRPKSDRNVICAIFMQDGTLRNTGKCTISADGNVKQRISTATYTYFVCCASYFI